MNNEKILELAKEAGFRLWCGDVFPTTLGDDPLPELTQFYELAKKQIDAEWVERVAAIEAVTRQEFEKSTQGLRESHAELLAALKKVTFMARTSGGTLGPDAELMTACGKAEDAIANAEKPEAS